MITLNGIKKQYVMGDNIVKALDGINLHIEEGEFTAIVGPSGSGKSTLMHIIGCLDIGTNGKYYLNNMAIDNYSGNELADIRNKEIGFVFQQFNLLPNLTAIENVELPLFYAGYSKLERTDLAKQVLNDVGLGERLYHRPSELSGGQQQRVSIARALANNPSIILADEPTGALDSKTGEEVLSLLKELNKKGKTVVIITHDMNIAQRANRIITIMDGKITSDSKAGDHHD